MLTSSCLSTISAQTCLAFVARKKAGFHFFGSSSGFARSPTMWSSARNRRDALSNFREVTVSTETAFETRGSRNAILDQGFAPVIPLPD
jgi:hypothetical protein